MPVTRTGFGGLFSTASGPTVNIPIPAAAVAGELAMMNLTVQQNTITTFVPPTGVTTLVNKLAPGSIAGVFWKILTAADKTAGFLQFSMADGGNKLYACGMATYNGVNVNKPIHIGVVGNDVAASTPANTPLITTTIPDCMMFGSFHINLGSVAEVFNPAPPMTELWDGTNTTGTAKRACVAGDSLRTGAVTDFRFQTAFGSGVGKAYQAHIFAIAPTPTDVTAPGIPTGLVAIRA